MTWVDYLVYVLVMAVVTYLIRMIPLTLLRRKLKSPIVRAFLKYVPYACLAAMTVPAIFHNADGSFSISGMIALAAALAVSFVTENLTVVALVTCAAMFLANWLLP